MRAFYFGCARGVWGQTLAGHHFYGPGGESVWSPQIVDAVPWGYSVDSQLAPRSHGRDSEPPQGEAALHHKDGWTALSFWDRTGDSRPNSNSTFLVDAELDFAAALGKARELFPELFDRFTFEVVPYEGVRG